MEIWSELKNASLSRAFDYSPSTYYLSIPNPTGTASSATLPNQVVSFGISGNGTISLESAVQFVVEEGTTVNRVYISTQPITGSHQTNLSDIIVLEGEEIKSFPELGIYMINTINISLVEGV